MFSSHRSLPACTYVYVRVPCVTCCTYTSAQSCRGTRPPLSVQNTVSGVLRTTSSLPGPRSATNLSVHSPLCHLLLLHNLNVLTCIYICACHGFAVMCVTELIHTCCQNVNTMKSTKIGTDNQQNAIIIRFGDPC